MDVVKEASNLPESWKPRQSTYKAITRYETFQDSPLIKSLKNMRKSIMLINNHIERLNQDISDLEKIEVQNSTEEGKGKDIEGQITTKITRIISLQQDLEKATTLLTSIEEKSKKINSDEDFKIKAGGRLGNREEPAPIGSNVS
jgi:pyridoxal/pyridoxine/pyridoxamine kinase